ncbi:nuclear transport factor 2 family protein [Actinomadura coerulea]|uniref:nuclear transport factor 2 family protein n=1 Tax=Actinomadura coerulea TaxID=46159 RepID=UPI0034304679
MASSARHRIRASRNRTTPTARRADIVKAFKQAWEAKDIDALINLFDSDATATGDGGGLASAELHPIRGAGQIARFFADQAGAAPDLTILECTVSGQPGLVAQQDGVTVTVMAFHTAGNQIKHIWAVRNPDKLRPWTTNRHPPLRPSPAATESH